MGKVKFVFLNIFIYVFCAFLCYLGVIHYIDDQGKAAAIRGGVIVQAEWVGIIPRDNGRASATYDLGYEYIDEKGIRYREQCTFGFSSVEEAESYIGKKVDIYIDGKGHSIAVYKAEKFNRNLAWTLMGLAIGVSISYTVGLIIWGVWCHKQKYKNTVEDSDTVQV